jgi:hypothetical protein
MTRSGKSMLIAGVLVAVAGSAYAQQQPMTAPTAPAQQQLSYTPAAPVPTAPDATNPDHFVKPAGYDQNPANYPYTRKGSGPKAN